MSIDIDEMRRKAEAGDTTSQAILGTLSMHGEEGIAVDYAEAFKWLSAANAEKTIYYLTDLGHLYEHGLGVQKDTTEAIRIYKQAARYRISEAAMQLARIYSQGLGIPADPDEGTR